MKTKLLLIALLISFNSLVFSQCPGSPPAGYTCIPDPNFEQALIDLTIDSEGTLDGQVLTADISGVTILNIPSKGISDLTGISGFTSLEKLFCNQNSLTSLDLTSNLALTQVNCYFNTSLSSLLLPNTNTLTHIEFYNCNLTSIDLTPYTNLDFLRSYNNPSLGSLDVTNSPNLQYLYCHNNGLNSLDVSQNTNLLILDCYQNNLNTLDVTNNTLLTRLWCHQNNITGSLDVSNNTALTSFYCHINQITSLDVSQNTLLDRLWCYSNQLTSLDVSNNTLLTSFRCHINQLNTLLLPVSNTLNNFWCYSNNLTSLDVSGLSALDYFDCGINLLNSLDVSMLSTVTELYCNSNQLTSLNLKNNNITYLWAQNNSGLTCIQVDDITVANNKTTTGDWQKDAGASYNTNCSLGLEELDLSSISIYPNPSKDKFYIDLQSEANYTLSNVFGQEVKKGILISGNNELQTNTLSNGLYMLNIVSPEGKVTKKIIKD